ncbi:aromatic ring-hydroxylating oxygenase subunit alpha [Oceanibacterium hippocampi]|uniref:Anthranilate 1,2-dioxygenase large subunit n=1 Tax=Oceanibacterium hippocampi TaxID=745714 RepID=A0A1Y5THP9_9PROT|nr:aromatic ring-hydroxylating dioxygenase subunit alpha [Oceanibacterium hippocampi]SLN64374.1 Anthranilate 1,2-dioxygenase large subunit [Oceanibacterium hippocampi]
MRDWICVAREEEIAEPGDFLTLNIIDEPVVVARNEAGNVSAFSNVCQHRGVAVVQGRGNRKRFSCPYHAWSYDLDGKLVAAPHMGEATGFDPKTCRMPQLGVGLWGGFVFINLADEPMPFSDFIGRFAEEFDYLRLQDCRLAERIEFDLPCNWKFVAENLLDAYHARVAHAKSFGKYRDTVDYFKDLPGQDGLFGEYNSSALVPGGQSLFGNMPWLEDKPSTFACLGHLPPNLQLFGRCDNAVWDAIWPINPDRTILHLNILFPKDLFKRDDFKAKLGIYADFQRQVIEEDRDLVTSLQRGAYSRKFVPGRLSTLEHGIYNLINYQIDRLSDADGAT